MEPQDKLMETPPSSNGVGSKEEESKETSPIDHPKQPPAGGPPNRTVLPTWRFAIIMASQCVGLLLSLMDTSIVATSLFRIALDFNSLARTIWVILAYTLSYVGFAIIFARSSDITGRKPSILLAFFIFFAASLGCGFSQTLTQLIACRTLQGVGGAGLYSLTMVTFLELTPPKLIPFMSSIIGMVIAVAGVLGPVLGGVITTQATWRWIFWLNGPGAFVPMVIIAVAFPNRIQGYAAVRRRFVEMDFVGCLLVLAASVLLVFGLQEAGTGAYAWDSGVVVGTITVGAVCWPVLVAWEWFYVARHEKRTAPILPVRLLKDRVMAMAILATLLTGFTYFLVIFNLPLRFQIVNLSTPSEAGIHLLPLLCLAALGSVLGGMSSSFFDDTFPSFFAAACFILLGAGLLSSLPNDLTVTASCYGYEVILGFGAGLTFSSVSILTTVTVELRDHAVAQGIVAQARVLGGSIGVAAANAIFHRTARADLAGVLSSAQIEQLQTSTQIFTSLNGGELDAVRRAFADAFSDSLRVCTYIAAVGVVVTALTWQRHPPSLKNRRSRIDMGTPKPQPPPEQEQV